MKNAILITVVSAITFFAGSAAAVPPVDDPFEYQSNGFYIGDCGDFDVLNDAYIAGYVRYRFDRNGDLAFIRLHLSATESVYYRSDDPSIYLPGGPGEVQNDLIKFRDDPPSYFVTGIPFKVTVPGHGVIFHEAGRIDFDLDTLEVIWQSGGPHDFNDQNLDALCDALSD